MNINLTESQQRTIERIKRMMQGPLLENFEDPKTVELMVNPNGDFYVEKLGEPMRFVCKVEPSKILDIIFCVSGFHEQVVKKDEPICEGEFPLDGSRFEATIPPIVGGPSFSLRKKAIAIFTLDDYVKSGIMQIEQAEVIKKAVADHKNILVVGGTGSGKTTLLNAIIDQMVKNNEQERVVIIEDTGELQCAAKNNVQLRATADASMTRLVKVSLRYRPDRILVGEVRGAEALDLLDAWNTGHPGGLATLHANSAVAGLTRLRSLVTRNEAAPKDIDSLIAECVDYVVNIVRHNKSRIIKDIINVTDYVNGQYVFSKVA